LQIDKDDVAVNSPGITVSELPISDLCQKVIDALHQTGYPHHRTLEILVDQGSVTVEGVLPTWHLRQVATECIRAVTGVTSVIDRIRVTAEAQHDGL
jgi:osmotically-inducible protein OsmY